jgi:2-oxoglutarate ferredoxin oxidoreductase subunit alpha
MASFVFDAFDLADKYRNPVMILADGALGQMMEKVDFPEYDPSRRRVPKPWATTGTENGRERNIITSLHIQPDKMEEINNRLVRKYRQVSEWEVRFESVMTDDAEVLLVAFGLAARVAHRTVELARDQGIRAGLLRPITLFPFPSAEIRRLAENVSSILVVEMNAGQMVDDVRLAVDGSVPVRFHGRMGGIVPSPDEVLEVLKPMASTGVEQVAEEVLP